MSSSKSKATISLNPVLWDQFKDETDSASQKIERLIEQYLELHGGDVSKLKSRKKKVEGKIGRVAGKIQELEQEKQDLQEELDSIESALEEASKEEEVVREAVDSLVPKVEEKRRSTAASSYREAVQNVSSTRVWHNWKERAGVSGEELRKRVLQEVEQ